MKETHNPYNNLPSDDEMGYINRKQRDADVFRSFEFKSTEEIIAICHAAVVDEQQKKQLEAWQPFISFEKLITTKLVNRKY